jgi:hypothetical protein
MVARSRRTTSASFRSMRAQWAYAVDRAMPKLLRDRGHPRVPLLEHPKPPVSDLRLDGLGQRQASGMVRQLIERRRHLGRLVELLDVLDGRNTDGIRRHER